MLREVRRQGFAIVESELEEGLLSATVPVRDPSGMVVAAMVYSTTVGRRTADQVAEEVIPVMLERAAALEQDLAALSSLQLSP